jgi:hypothetical protein
MRSIAWIAFGGAVLLAGGAAHADVVGSFEGTLASKSGTQPISAVFKQVGNVVNGTVALPGNLATFGDQYVVGPLGKSTKKRLKFQGPGDDNGAFLKGNLKVSGSTLTGKVKIKVPGSKPLNGKVSLTLNPPVSDGTSCDAVYQEPTNKTFFDDSVMDALNKCGECHGPGLQAESTRLSVNLIDPLATARAIVPFIDSANPSASKLLTKPLYLVPHGGGSEITAGSAEEQALQSWIALIAAAHCN